MHGDIDRVIAGRTFDIVDVERELRTIAERKEARQRRLHDDRIAHDHVGLLALPTFVLRPGDRHQPHAAVEGGKIESRPRALPSAPTFTTPE